MKISLIIPCYNEEDSLPPLYDELNRVSSEMSELLGLCDKILIMSGGRVAAIEETKNLTQEKIMEYAAKYI